MFLYQTYKRLDTPISSALAADVTAIKTTKRMATAPPLPITTAAAAGAASPALVWEADSGFGYVGNFGCNRSVQSLFEKRR